MNEPSTEAPVPPPNSGTASARLWLAVGLPAVILAGSYLPFLLVRTELPDRVASHFDGAGRPDDSMSVGVFLVVTSVIVAIGLALSIGVALRHAPLPQGLGATLGFLGPFLAALGGGILASTAITQRGIDHWTDAPNIGWSLLGVLAVSLAAGTAGAWFGAKLPVADDQSNLGPAPVMGLSDAEQAVWTATLHSTALYVLGAVTALVGIVLLATTTFWIYVTPLLASIPVLALATLHVRVDRAGLRVKYGRLPWPTTLVSIDRIDTASVIDVRPMQWGGWGYRGSLKLMRQAAVVHRAGPGIRLDLNDGKVFVVTIDDPETGVALLNAQIGRRQRV